MPSVAERTRNNIRAGVFVSITLILVLVIIVTLTDFWRSFFYRTRDYIVTFDVASGVKNLKPGSDVWVGGVTVGEVTSIEPRVSEGEAFEFIDVGFTVDQRITLWVDAKVFVGSPLLGSDAWLDIPDVGDPMSGLPVEGRLVGSRSAGMLTTLLGPANAKKTEEVVSRTEEFSKLLERMPTEYDQRVVPILDNAGETVGGIREIVADFRDERWPRWSVAVDDVMTWAADATGRLDAVLDDGHDLMAEAKAVVEENRPQVKSLIDNAQASSENLRTASDRVNAEILEKVDALLDTGREGLESTTAVIQTLQQDYEEWAVDIGDTLANLNLAGQQLKLTSVELRRSPWKLMYRPQPDELEHELLYEAARSFAVAAADLKAASASAQRILDKHGDRLAEDREAFQRLQGNLLDSLNRYEQAQQELFDVLLVNTP
ncbi:MAG: hypothetical protein JSV91_02455 [Phycisphaerales bacterium]|nr:MAG: hypothetical protein JSV91_02455 [Phycisphaerales bacterium]